MIKVCQVTCVHDRYDARIFYKIAKSLSDNGYDSYILCMDSKGNEERNGVKFISVNYKPKNRINRILKSWKKMANEALKIDAEIYQLHDPELLPLGKFLTKKHKKVIFDSHEDGRDIGIKKWIPTPFRRLVCKLYLSYEKKAIKRIAGCISVDKNIVDRLANHNKNCVQITNYPFLPKKYNHSINGYICYAGSPESYAQYEFISALENVTAKNKYYLITNLQDESIQRCKNLKKWGDVVKSGYVTFEELTDIYQNTCLGMSLAYPDIGTDNWNGVVGVTKLFEFLAFGIPVICSSFNLWKDIVSKYNCGIYANPYDVNEISQKLNELLNDPEKLKELGHNARIAAEQEFNWATQEKKLLDYYKTIEEL